MNKAKDILIVAVVIAAFLGCLYGESRLSELEKLQANQLAQLEELETRQIVLQKELLARTDPAYVDMSLRNHFDKVLRESVNQVRGIDGKFERER